MKWIEANARKWYVVQEIAGKSHIQAVFILKVPVGKDAPRMAFKRINKDYVLPALKVHPHKDLLGALGYQDGTVLACEGFDNEILDKAKKYYSKRVQGKYYTQHAATLQELPNGKAKAMKAHIMAKEHCDEHSAEKKMVAMGMVWSQCKTFTPYVAACKQRDAAAK